MRWLFAQSFSSFYQPNQSPTEEKNKQEFSQSAQPDPKTVNEKRKCSKEDFVLHVVFFRKSEGFK